MTLSWKKQNVSKINLKLKRSPCLCLRIKEEWCKRKKYKRCGMMPACCHRPNSSVQVGLECALLLPLLGLQYWDTTSRKNRLWQSKVLPWSYNKFPHTFWACSPITHSAAHNEPDLKPLPKSSRIILSYIPSTKIPILLVAWTLGMSLRDSQVREATKELYL